MDFRREDYIGNTERLLSSVQERAIRVSRDARSFNIDETTLKYGYIKATVKLSR